MVALSKFTNALEYQIEQPANELTFAKIEILVDQNLAIQFQNFDNQLLGLSKIYFVPV
jgi:hypothetical protein